MPATEKVIVVGSNEVAFELQCAKFLCAVHGIVFEFLNVPVY